MGETRIRNSSDPEELRSFMKKVLADLRAMEKMLAESMFETDTNRISAEQEMFLVDAHHRPALVAM